MTVAEREGGEGVEKEGGREREKLWSRKPLIMTTLAASCGQCYIALLAIIARSRN